jgi:hypothetical protein
VPAVPRRVLRSRVLALLLTVFSLVVTLRSRADGSTLLAVLLGLTLVLLLVEEHRARRYRQRTTS